MEALRSARRADTPDAKARIHLSAADPLNVTGILTPPPRIPATLANRVLYVGGVPEVLDDASTRQEIQNTPGRLLQRLLPRL